MVEKVMVYETPVRQEDQNLCFVIDHKLIDRGYENTQYGHPSQFRGRYDMLRNQQLQNHSNNFLGFGCAPGQKTKILSENQNSIPGLNSVCSSLGELKAQIPWASRAKYCFEGKPLCPPVLLAWGLQCLGVFSSTTSK